MHELSLAKDGASPGAQDDASLVRAARRDANAFARLYRRYVMPVYRYLYSRVGDASDAEDLTSQVFAEALEGLPAYREQGHFSAWLFSIARRKAADHFRRERVALPLDEAAHRLGRGGDPLPYVVREETLSRLAALVAGLDDEQQELLRLRFAGDLTYAEIGAILGRSEAAVKMAMHRLLRRLEAQWGDEEG